MTLGRNTSKTDAGETCGIPIMKSMKHAHTRLSLSYSVRDRSAYTGRARGRHRSGWVAEWWSGLAGGGFVGGGRVARRATGSRATAWTTGSRRRGGPKASDRRGGEFYARTRTLFVQAGRRLRAADGQTGVRVPTRSGTRCVYEYDDNNNTNNIITKRSVRSRESCP